LIKYFGIFGRVDNAIVMRDKETQRGRGFGFVLLSFKDEEDAQNLKKKILFVNHLILNSYHLKLF
jgi:RNA recognition motif-containing protein